MAPKSRLVKPEPGIVAPPPVVPPVAAVRPAVPAVSTPFGFETSTSLPNPLQDAWAFRPKEAVAGGLERSPGVEPLPPAVAPPRLHASIDSELEMVQRKIKALADEVNSAEASRMQNAGLDAGAMQQSAIDHSVGALKAASQSMRERNVAVAQPQPQLQPPPRVQDTARFPSAELLIPATAQRIAVSLPEPEQNNHDRDYAAVLVPAATRLPEPLQQPQHHAVAAAPIPAPVPAPTAPDARIAAFSHAIHIGNMDVYFAPIVGLQDQAVRHYEVSVRLKTPSGMLIENAEDVVERAASDIAGLFDCARLSRSASFAGRLEALRKPGSVMSSVTGQAITDVRFLETFARLYEERQSIAAQLVLTFRQSDVAHFSAPAWQALDDMNAFGFRFAIDRVEHLDMDFAALVQRGFAFVKLPARAFLDGLPVANGMVPASDICRHLAATGLTLVAEAIDDEALRACVFGFGTLLGQGQLFGGARPINLEHAQAARTAAA